MCGMLRYVMHMHIDAENHSNYRCEKILKYTIYANLGRNHNISKKKTFAKIHKYISLHEEINLNSNMTAEIENFQGKNGKYFVEVEMK